MTISQPAFPSTANSGSKTCWTCDALTPYGVGFCDACWGLVPPDIAVTFTASLGGGGAWGADPWATNLRLAVVGGVRSILFTRREFHPTPRTAAPLDLSLDDLMG